MRLVDEVGSWRQSAAQPVKFIRAVVGGLLSHADICR